jgi:DNA-binding PadR family transcriptional regulator
LYEKGYLEMREENYKKYYKATEKGKEVVKDTIFPWNQRKEEINSIDTILGRMEDYAQFIIDNSGKLNDTEKDRIKKINSQLGTFK